MRSEENDVQKPTLAHADLSPLVPSEEPEAIFHGEAMA